MLALILESMAVVAALVARVHYIHFIISIILLKSIETFLLLSRRNSIPNSKSSQIARTKRSIDLP